MSWRRALSAAAGLVAILGAGAFLPTTAHAAAPRWELSSLAAPTNFAPGDASGDDIYILTATNIGDAPTAGEVKITDLLPAGLTATSVGLVEPEVFAGLPIPCSTVPVRCKFSGPVRPGRFLRMIVHLAVASSPATGTLANSATVTGGGASNATAASTNPLSASPAPAGIQSFAVDARNSDGSSSTQAGAHPYALTTNLALNTEIGGTNASEGSGFQSSFVPVGDPDDIVADLPPGLIGNPRAALKCSLGQFAASACPVDSQVGTARIVFGGDDFTTPLYNLVPSFGRAAQLGFLVGSISQGGQGGIPFQLTGGVRTGADYGLRVIGAGLPEVEIKYVSVTVWGVPAAHGHDLERGQICDDASCHSGGLESSEAADPRPFLANPTDCSAGALSAGLSVDNYEQPGLAPATAAAPLPAFTGCNQLAFEPSISARPTTDLADSPSGLAVDLKVPQPQEPEGLAEANLRDATVTLPPGLLVNPASASGLQGCSEAQIELEGPEPATCPDAAKLGSVEVDTPLLDHPLPGAVYLARPDANPFGSLLAIYVAVDDPETGVVVKLAGKVTPNPDTGQLTTTFAENPQLPFEDFKLNFFGGAQGTLRTPPTCGTYTSTTELTPFSAPESGPPATPSDEFQILGPPTGTGSCPRSAASEPNSPVFHAGTEAPQAGAYSPFALKVVREDGSQELSGIETVLPPGLVGKLAGVAECPDAALSAAAQKSGNAERAAPSCPASSQVGTVSVGAGAGPDPIYVSGHAYLAGPYKGAPLSLAIVTPALAGPFDLGTVVVRTALFVDPLTTQIRAVSDEIPHILQGIPLDVRSISLTMNRPDFTLNPTNCSEFAFGGAALTVLGRSTPLSQRFQVGGCQALKFKPSLKVSLKGSTKHAGHPALEAVVTYPQQGAYANIAAAQVALPHSEFIDQANLNKTCTRPVLLEGKCPPSSIYGKAKAWTPLLDHPLEGPVYLVGGFGYKLPALVAELDGQIRVLLVGKVDTGPNKGIRNTFEAVPDAPVSRFVLRMKGGKKYSLLENSEDLCRKPQKAKATFTAQNGKVVRLEPTIANSCKGKGKGKRHAKGKGHKPKGNGHGKGGKGSKHGDAQSLLERLGGW